MIEAIATASKLYKTRQRWNICIQNPFLNCDRVHPIQQRKIRCIIDALSACPSVKRITIFGSSVTPRCHNGSDVDLYVEMDCHQKVPMPVCDFAYDLWTNYTIVKPMLEEIAKKGVVVYERER